MGHFKEQIHDFEKIQQKQVRIYNDAGDYGYPYKKDDPTAEIDDLIHSVKYLQEIDKEFEGQTVGLIRERNVWTNGVSVKVRIIHESEDGYYIGTQYNISFNRLNPKSRNNMHKGCDAFISVDSCPFTEKMANKFSFINR